LSGGSINIIKDVSGTLVVTITRASGASLTAYTNAAKTVSASFPASITVDTRYYLADDDDYVVSVKRNGIEIADNLATKAVRITGDKNLSFGPTPGLLNLVSESEVAPGAWTAYTPTLGGFTPGDGVATGEYRQVGKTVEFWAKFVLGATSAGASAAPTLTLPVTASAASHLPLVGSFYDVSATTYYNAVAEQTSTTVASLYIPGASGVFTVLSTTAPFTWATGDIIYLRGTYEAA
jgi:hypothetical protein